MSHSKTTNATRAEIDLPEIFVSGTFKNVWAGIYTEGARRGQCCSKEFKTGSVLEAHYFEELNIIRRMQEIIDDFDNAGVIGNGGKILLNTPAVWTYEDSGKKSLIELMIENFEKFNSNMGWAPITGTEWSEAVQILSHFSYYDSNRQFLLCDLQGDVYRDGY